MDTGKVRQFVKVSDGRIGVVMANETCGGVLRGHCDVWFGDFVRNEDNKVVEPLVEQLLVEPDWEVVECQMGYSTETIRKCLTRVLPPGKWPY